MPTDKPVADAPGRMTPLDTAMPQGTCDAHVHLVGDDFPLWEGRVEDPAPGSLDQWLDMYRAHLAALGATKGVIVHSILYGADNSVTLEAVRRLGDGFKGIGLVRDGASETEIARLAEAGIKGVRLNYVHGGVLSWEGAKALAPMLAAHGLHIEMLAHSHLHLEELAEDVATLPVDIVFDHCAWPDLSLGLSTPGAKVLYRLLADGKCWTKLSALYRFAGDAPGRALEMAANLAQANPERILWGSDWPHLMLNGVPMPDAGDQLNALRRALPRNAEEQLFVTNPATLYGFGP